jgi:amino acid adenylation domain-containing protein
MGELGLQYGDYAQWQREWLVGEVLDGQLRYWREQLRGAPPVLELATDRPRPPIQGHKGATQSFILSKEISESLKELSRSEGTTLFMTLLAAFQALLSYHSGQEDICIGTPVANRNRIEIENLIGFFVNTLVMRTDFSGDPSFRKLLKQVREVCLGAYAHQDLPFEKLVEELQPERSLSRNPLFQVMFALQTTSETTIRLAGLTTRPMVYPRSTVQFDLSLTMVEMEQGLAGTLEYSTDLFEATTIDRMLSHFENLLKGFTNNPDERLSRLSLLGERERQQVLVAWNDTAAPSPLESTVHGLFERQVGRTPKATALVSHTSSLTYQELNERANQKAHHLRALGVGPEVKVGILLERSTEMIVALLAVLKAGGAYLPLDPEYPEERLSFMFADACACVLLTRDSLRAKLRVGGAQVVCVDTDKELVAQQRRDNLQVAVSADNLAYVIYTSGSTGRPKGVMVSHGSLSNFTEAAVADYELKESDRVLQFASISFDAAAEELYPCLMCGAALVLRTEEMLSTAGTFLRRCDEWGITVLDLPTAYWHELSANLEAEPIEIPPAVRLVIIGGEKLSAGHLALWRQHARRDVRLLNTYGPTEATVVATACDVSALQETRPFSADVSIGRPLRNVRVYILDKHLQPVAVGVPGELYIAGSGLARGYLNRPELTAEKFIPDPFDTRPGTRLYKTNDLVRFLPDGEIEFLGRTDSQLKVRGFRIESGEVEAALCAVAGVKQAVVIAGASGSRTQLLAYVLMEQEAAEEFNAGRLRQALSERLPQHMIPQAFIRIEEIPLTVSGKVDRRALPVPEGERPELDNLYTPPRTPTEELLADIWAHLLSIEQVGVHDDFFALGGHSLLATQFISRVREKCRVELSLHSIFERPTVAGLAQQIETLRCITRVEETRPETAVEDYEEGDL